MSWTEERVELLTKLWTEGKSASDIAKELGDVTRNAVIGKVHRLGLKGRVTKNVAGETKPVKKKAAPKPKKEEVAKPAPKAKEVVEPVEADSDDEQTDAPVIEIAANDDVPLEAREQAAKVEQESKRLTRDQFHARSDSERQN